jgi:hypothetical protein
MKDVMRVRVSSEGRRRLRELARREKKEVSTVARELMDYGWVFLMLRDHRAGRVSLGTFAHPPWNPWPLALSSGSARTKLIYSP